MNKFPQFVYYENYDFWVFVDFFNLNVDHTKPAIKVGNFQFA